jgi:hypothetical protein
MIRVKFLRNHKEHKEGDTVFLSPNEAFGLIDSGVAIVSKDMVANDYHIAQVPSVFSVPQTTNKQPYKYKRK